MIRRVPKNFTYHQAHANSSSVALLMFHPATAPLDALATLRTWLQEPAKMIVCSRDLLQVPQTRLCVYRVVIPQSTSTTIPVEERRTVQTTVLRLALSCRLNLVPPNSHSAYTKACARAPLTPRLRTQSCSLAATCMWTLIARPFQPCSTSPSTSLSKTPCRCV